MSRDTVPLDRNVTQGSMEPGFSKPGLANELVGSGRMSLVKVVVRVVVVERVTSVVRVVVAVAVKVSVETTVVPVSAARL